MRVFRLTRSKYAAELNGKGAALCGARWNSKGTEILYTSESRALAMAEVAVHLSLDNLPDDFLMLEIDIPDGIAAAPDLSLKDLPSDWHFFPPLPGTQLIGDRFIREERFCILRAPSAVVKGDFNMLINPNHKDFGKIRIVSSEKFPFDRRYFNR